MAYTHYKIKELFAKILENLVEKKDLLDFGGSLNSVLNWAYRYGTVSEQWRKGLVGQPHSAVSGSKSATPLFHKCTANTVTGLVNPLYTWEEVSLNKETGEAVTTGKYYVYRGGVTTWSKAAATVANNGVVRQAAKIDISSLMLDPTTEAVCFFSFRSARVIGCSGRVFDNGNLYLNVDTMAADGVTSNTTTNIFIYEPAPTEYDVTLA